MASSIKATIISEFDARGTVQARAEMDRTAVAARRAGASANAIGDGVGFDTLAGKARKGAKAVGFLSTAMGDAKGAAGLVAKTASGAFFALGTGGPWALAAAAVLTLTNHFKQLVDKAQEASQVMRKAFYTGLINSYSESIRTLGRDYAENLKDVDLYEKRVNALAAAAERLDRSANSAASAEASKMSALIEAGTSTAETYAAPDAKGLADAEGKLELVRQMGAEQVRVAEYESRASEKSSAAEAEKLKIARERLDLARKQRSELESKLSKIPTGESIGNPRAEQGFNNRYAVAGSGWIEKLTSQSLEAIGRLKAGHVGPAVSEADWAKVRKETESSLKSLDAEIYSFETEVQTSQKNVTAAEYDVAAAAAKLATVRTKSAQAETEAVDEFDKLTKALGRRADLQQRIIRQEQRLEAAQQKLADVQASAAYKRGLHAEAVSEGPKGWHEKRKQERDAEKQRQRDLDREQRWADNAEKRQAAGVRLSKGTRERLADFKNWQRAALNGGEREESIARGLSMMLKSAQDNLGELRGLRSDLSAVLKARS